MRREAHTLRGRITGGDKLNTRLLAIGVVLFTSGSFFLLGSAHPSSTLSQPVLQITDMVGGKTVGANISNIGDGNATDVIWSINLEGGMIVKGAATSGNKLLILPNSTFPLRSDKIIGFGKTTITVSATCAEDVTADLTGTGFVFAFWVLNVK